MSAAAYPLQWPAGWPRTPSHQMQDSKYRFRRVGRYSKSQSPFWTFAEARDALNDELDRLGARNLVLSSNYELRLDGQPSAKAGNPIDRGIAIYFTLKGKPMVMACDMHVRAEENMRSLTLAIEAMRQLERHGGGIMMERAFEGFQAVLGKSLHRAFPRGPGCCRSPRHCLVDGQSRRRRDRDARSDRINGRRPRPRDAYQREDDAALRPRQRLEPVAPGRRREGKAPEGIGVSLAL